MATDNDALVTMVTEMMTFDKAYHMLLLVINTHNWQLGTNGDEMFHLLLR